VISVIGTLDHHRTRRHASTAMLATESTLAAAVTELTP
jgi:hypothetical protein